MIDNRELRIGNLVALSGSLILTVYEIHEDCFYAKDAKGSSFKNTWADLKPIPLSEEVLLKCGFKNEIDEIDGKMYNIYFVTNTDYLIEYFHSDKKYVFTDDMGLKVDIKYLHQLQNIYYTLTGEELEVSL